MAKRKPGLPWINVTSIRGLLAGDDKCRWAAWFRARFGYGKHVREDDDFDMDQWRRDHDAMVATRARILENAGYTVYLEGQNEFKIEGKFAILKGKPDIVAVRAMSVEPMRGPDPGLPTTAMPMPASYDVLVVDCKTGREKDSDRWQLLCYLFGYTIAEHPGFPKGNPVRGEVEYRDKSYHVKAEQFTPRERQAILAEIGTIASENEPMRMPSETECHYCDIPATECKSRVAAKPATKTTEF